MVYPVKSLGGICIESAKAFTEGFEHDRRWMLVNENGKFMSQRENAIMALFKTKLSHSGVEVNYHNSTIEIPFEKNNEDVLKVSVWESKLKAPEVDKEISQWFSEHLKMNVRLVTMSDISSRYKRLFKAPFKTYVSFADGYPYLILGQKSLETLNEKLESPVDIDRFRANIIVSTHEAHEEDKWNEFDVGSTKMSVIKPCARCAVVTIDQSSAQKGKEPLKTLSTYRQKRNKIYFGANAILLKQGEIAVGDTINF